MRPVGRVVSPMSDGSHELSQRGYSLHQSQLVGNEKRRTEGLRTKRRWRVTWGSPTRGDAQGDGAAIVVSQQETVEGAKCRRRPDSGSGG